jgi:2-polyprenyl-6-methoxyphenol hydroxylase-like FAD-dependent oxidoreductase
MRSERCEVLIVGAGPVGLLLALLLHQRGVDVMIVERQKALYPLPRAVLFDHEARRIFGSADLSGQVDSILENVIGQGGEEGINFVWRDAELKRKARFRIPPKLLFAQHDV